jgi:hypothetical protein
MAPDVKRLRGEKKKRHEWRITSKHWGRVFDSGEGCLTAYM